MPRTAGSSARSRKRAGGIRNTGGRSRAQTFTRRCSTEAFATPPRSRRTCATEGAFPMGSTRRLREGIRRGRIRCSVRIWTRAHVKVDGRYPMDEGHIVVDAIEPMTIRGITFDLARESGFDSVKDLLSVAKHRRGRKVFLIRFHYLPPGAWDGPRWKRPHK